MTKAEQSRDHLVAARLALLDAELEIAFGDPKRAVIQLDLAQAYTAEARRKLLQPEVAMLPVEALSGNPAIGRLLE